MRVKITQTNRRLLVLMASLYLQGTTSARVNGHIQRKKLDAPLRRYHWLMEGLVSRDPLTEVAGSPGETLVQTDERTVQDPAPLLSMAEGVSVSPDGCPAKISLFVRIGTEERS